MVFAWLPSAAADALSRCVPGVLNVTDRLAIPPSLPVNVYGGGN